MKICLFNASLLVGFAMRVCGLILAAPHSRQKQETDRKLHVHEGIQVG